MSLVLQCSDQQSRKQRSQWGLMRALSANAIRGVSSGFIVIVKLVGVGYRAVLEDLKLTESAGFQPGRSLLTGAGNNDVELAHPDFPRKPFQQLVLRLGYPRPVRIAVPASVTCSLESPTEIKLLGQDKNTLGRLAADIRRRRKPEPYNGKGIFVGGEAVRRKEVKKK